MICGVAVTQQLAIDPLQNHLLVSYCIWRICISVRRVTVLLIVAGFDRRKSLASAPIDAKRPTDREEADGSLESDESESDGDDGADDRDRREGAVSSLRLPSDDENDEHEDRIMSRFCAVGMTSSDDDDFDDNDADDMDDAAP